MSAASLRLNGKFGIFGCGSSRKRAIFSGVKSALRAIVAKNGGSVGTGPLLISVDHVTGGAPALGEIGAMVGVGGFRRRPAQPSGGNDQNPNLSRNGAHSPFSFDIK